jgi:hypothetical protein
MIGLVVAACAAPSGTAPAASPVASTAAAPVDTGFTGGTATATVTLPDGALEYAGGACERGIGDAWLAVNIGQPDGAEYFGLIAGRSPYSPTDVPQAAGGGTLKGDAVVVAYRHAGRPFVLDHDSATVVVASDLSHGTFSGHLADGTPVEGVFGC